ncbi:hypothetical protein OH773_21660 [Buttiauxella sp. WJP83]|uniref:hypothetical protein n=1 Tax=Buttiauxella sp. WJP83 TaxID=2986951 RepID=UPI0022DE3D51|nr:hypothetical protein [Buttiauxella sp. WJP83]WBM70679.1 hypothetical protein OH773_21660 [Buttiauxella sp. WJP83]
MTMYHVRTRINSNVPSDYILYDLSIYRMDSDKNKYFIVDVKQQPLQGNYETLIHATDNISEPLSTIYIMEVTLYRTTMLKTSCVSATPFIRMYTLEELTTGKAWSSVKRENPCYFVTTGTTKLESEGPNIVTVNISRPERPFIAEEYPIGDPQDPFEKSIIEQQINNRFNWVDYPSQRSASLCGPASFFYCIQRDRPDVYAQAARELWMYGKTKIGGLEIKPSNGCRHPTGHFYDNISGLDWMTLAGLRDSENAVLSFDNLDSPIAGITMWQTLTEWFEKAGYEKVFSNVGITQAGIQGINDLNEYVRKGYKVVTLINDGLLTGGESKLTVPTHWIVWDGPVTEENDGCMHLNLFSWGKISDQIKYGENSSFFINRFFGGVVFKPLK